MTQDSRYVSVEYVYRSQGLWARAQIDQAPQYSYLDLLNGYERAEGLLSSRYGCIIINRDPVGTGTANYFFTSPVTTITKLTFQSAAYRYAGLSNGSLQRRSSNIQGQYSQVSAPGTFSGNPMTSLVTNCFQTSQPYIFFYDSAASLKDSGTFSTLELTGIDAPAYTLNAQPYSPLLTLINNFASGNSYTTSGFSSAWAFSSVTTIPAQSGQTVVDFTEFVNLSSTPYTPSGTPPYSAGANINFVGTTTNSFAVSGFPSVSTTGDIVTAILSLSGSLAITSGFAGSGFVTFSYSINGGVTWIPFYSYSGSSAQTFTPANVTLNIAGLSNLNQLEFQIFVSATVTTIGTGAGVTTTGFINSVTATIATSPGIFGNVCNGILSNLNTNSSINVPITTVVSSGLSSGLYQTLTVTTQAAHGLSTGNMIALYGASNDLVDGFYQATVTSTTTFTVPYISSVLLSATGGFVVGGAATGPAECVLINEYSTPYPTQMSAWGFYQQVPLTTTSFPIGSFQGTVAANSVAKVGVTANFDLSINNQVKDADLIVLTLKVGSPANISSIRLQFDVNGSGYTSSYYYKDIAPAYYQGNVANTVAAYQATQNQILADTLGLVTGQPPTTTTAQLQPGNFSTGGNAWVAVYIPRGNFLPVGSAGQSGLDWTNITGWQIVITTNTSGSSTVAANGLYLQWGYGPSSFAGVGYDYRFTYYNLATGTESSPNPEQEFSTQFGYLSSLSAPIYLRQAVQLTAQYSTDPQVTHLRVYRRGGTLSANWLQIDQVPNITAGGQFVYKDVIADAALAEAPPLILDNDPPVTSSLVTPIATTLSLATTGPGNTYYSIFQPQFINTSFATPATFVPGQIVDVGSASNLEQVTVITGGTDGFVAILRLQHNAGEPVNAYATPRTKCNLSALAYNRVWLAGDPTNPHYLYFSKTGLPENFSPTAYVPCGSPEFPITIVVNWRGTLFVATTETWYVIVNGAQPYAQPTGSAHGAIAPFGWAEIESGIAYRAGDGLRVFAGADGAYMSLPIEWIYRQQAFGPVPLADPTESDDDIVAFYNNFFYTSYISLSSGKRYRLAYSTDYRRFRYDDLGATAMFWERDTNLFLIGIPVPGTPGSYCVAQDQVYTQDYDDGGWQLGALSKIPISLTIQTPYLDLGKPHFPKQFNVLEVDANTQGQLLNTTLQFQTEPLTTLSLAAVSSTQRQKLQLQIQSGEGYPAYSVSIQHTIAVTTAPLLYQENVYAALLADYRTSYDTYWIKFNSDLSKIVKQGYFDYTSTAAITVQLFADDGSGGGVGSSLIPYYTFTLPAEPNRESVRVLFPAKKCRLWRLVATSTAPFQWWNNPTVLQKPAGPWGSTYTQSELPA